MRPECSGMHACAVELHSHGVLLFLIIIIQFLIVYVYRPT